MKKVVLLALACVALAGCERDIKIGNTGYEVDGSPFHVKNDEAFKYNLTVAISHHRLDIVKKYLESGGVDVNYIVSERYNGTLLHTAAYCGATDIVEFLVNSGANINARLIETSNSTPLHEAIWKKHQDTAIKLLDLGADPSIRLNRYGIGDGISTCRLTWLVHQDGADMSRVIARLPGCKDAKFDDKS